MDLRISSGRRNIHKISQNHQVHVWSIPSYPIITLAPAEPSTPKTHMARNESPRCRTSSPPARHRGREEKNVLRGGKLTWTLKNHWIRRGNQSFRVTCSGSMFGSVMFNRQRVSNRGAISMRLVEALWNCESKTCIAAALWVPAGGVLSMPTLESGRDRGRDRGSREKRRHGFSTSTVEQVLFRARKNVDFVSQQDMSRPFWETLSVLC